MTKHLSFPRGLIHYTCMSHGLRKAILTYGAALMLAVLSIVSAHHMAPDRDDSARMEAFIAMGSLAQDLCGLEPGGAEHRCPFCHKLPDALRIAAPDLTHRVLPVFLHVVRHSLVVGPERRLAPVGVRAPPFSA